MAPSAVDEDVPAAAGVISEGMPGVEAAAAELAALEVAAAAVIDWSLWPAADVTAVLVSTTVELSISVVVISETAVTNPWSGPALVAVLVSMVVDPKESVVLI